MRKVILGLALTCCMSAVPGSVFAAGSGYVYGYIYFYQHQTNRCQVNCSGAKYTSSQYKTSMPVEHAIVYLYNESTGNTLASGTISSTGYYYLPFNTSESLTNVQIRWRPEDKDGHFRILDSTGNRYYFPSTTFNLGSGSGIAYNRGTLTWGTSTSPNNAANVYDGAQRGYNQGLSASSRLRNVFTGVDIWTNKTGCSGAACLLEGNGGKRIYMNSTTWLGPEQFVVHEMGHAASYLSSPATRSNYATYALECGTDFDGAGSGWEPTSQEYRCTSMEEATAGTAATYAFYYHNATHPKDYWGDNIESYGASCTTAMQRHQRSAAAYLWDALDNQNDGETIDLDFYHIWDTLARYDNGFGNRQVNEPRSPSWSYDDREGRSPDDFYWNLRYRHPDAANTSSLLTKNCLN